MADGTNSRGALTTMVGSGMVGGGMVCAAVLPIPRNFTTATGVHGRAIACRLAGTTIARYRAPAAGHVAIIGIDAARDAGCTPAGEAQ